jgi:RHS repeat-associated protein
MPFGEELLAGVGGRTSGQGYGGAETLRKKFIQYERDNESGLDFAQARYYSSAQGRFTSPDEFWKDSQFADPQSWNKYSYVRNNPLKYIDPTGEKATVEIKTDEKNKTGTITITASIAIYSQGNSNLSQDQLKQAQAAIKSSIEGAWSGTFEQDGITYTVTTTVDVQVYGSEKEGMASGAQNIIGISKEDSIPGKAISHVDKRSLFSSDLGPDTGVWKFDRIVNGRQAAHEFTHILGADNTTNRANVSFSPSIWDFNKVNKYGSATGFDYRHTLGGAINNHREESRTRVPTAPCCPYPTVRLPTIYVPSGPPQSYTSTRVIVYR